MNTLIIVQIYYGSAAADGSGGAIAAGIAAPTAAARRYAAVAVAGTAGTTAVAVAIAAWASGLDSLLQNQRAGAEGLAECTCQSLKSPTDNIKQLQHAQRKS